MSVEYRIGDVRALLAEMPAGSVDLICTSWPYLEQRDYLAPDDPMKALEIGHEGTPTEYIRTLLGITAEFRRVLAPHGSIATELGDKFSDSGGAGGDYGPNGLRAGQQKFRKAGGEGWPLERSLTMIPELYRVALAYGIHPLTGETSPAGRWRVRNVVVHGRPNPPVGALGDKYRPACSYWAVACVNRRWFDLDAVRHPHSKPDGNGMMHATTQVTGARRDDGKPFYNEGHEAGAPPLDWFEGECDQFERDLLVIPTSPYSGAVLSGTLYRASPDCPEHSPRAILQRLRTGSHGELQEALKRNSRRTDLRPEQRQRFGQFSSSDLDSPDLLHAIVGFLHQTIQSERTTGNNGASKRRVQRSGGSPSSDATPTDRTSSIGFQPTLLDQTLSPFPLSDADAAMPHDTLLSRTDLAPLTNPSGMPSSQTSGGTGDTPKSLESSDPDGCTPESSISPLAASMETQSHKSHTSRCSCIQYIESTSHYATFAPELVRRFIVSMCPARVCRECEKPSTRITKDLGQPDRRRQYRTVANRISADTGLERNVQTLGWSDCGHNAWRPGVVLDPFGGTGTTGMVAAGNGRDALLFDLDGRNLDLARERIGLFLDEPVA